MIKLAPKACIRRQSEALNGTWHVTAPADHTLADALSPTYLAAKVRLGDVKPGDTFEIRHEKHAFLLRAYVTDVDREAGAISFVATEVIDLTALPVIQYDFADAHVTKTNAGWAVARADGMCIRNGFATEGDAREWLAAKQQLAAAGNVAAT